MSNQLTTIEQTDIVTIETGRIDENPAVVYLASLAKGSRAAMERALNTICGILGADDPNVDENGAPLPPRDERRITDQRYLFLPWHELRFQHTQAIRAKLNEQYTFSTVNKTLSALRGVLKSAWRLGLMSSDDYRQAVDVENVKGQREPAGRSISQGELSALLTTCKNDVNGIRDAAIISILYACGLRRAELVNLTLADYDPLEGKLLVRGKGNKERQVPIVNGTANALNDWLIVRGEEPGPLFYGVGNRNSGGKLRTQAIYKMLQVRAELAEIPDLSPHDFRRTTAGDMLDAGVDMVTVQKLLGHADPATTARYDRRGFRAKQQAAAKLHVPYTQRTLKTE